MQNPTSQPSGNNYYSKADFWDERYQAGGYFDWYAEFPELQYAFQTQYGMTKDDSILMVGCGNSKVSQQMYEAGYKNIINIDISPTVIQQMKQLSPGMEWLVMDATEMTFEDRKFDFVIDKGTLDALIAGRDLSPAIKLLKQCMRVTKEEGQLIQITYGSPQGRKKVFEAALPIHTFDYYFAYVNLSDTSTLINLMRNNLIGPNGEKIQKQIALQKSMKEFMMIKLLRAKRSKDKQFVIWQNFAKKPLPQVVEKLSIGQLKKQEQSSKVESENNIKSQETDQKKQTHENENVKYQSKPQKQSYVYAYSIKMKFGYDFDSFDLKSVEMKKSYEGSSTQLHHFQIKGSKNVNQSIAQSKLYCVKKQISHSSVDFVEINDQFSSNQKSVKLRIQQSDTVRLNILSKTNIHLTVTFNDLKDVMQSLNNIGTYLTEKMGLNFHPCPKTYSLFVVMKGRMKVKTVNELLAKYWYPTFIFLNIDITKGEAQVLLSIPPVLPQHLANFQKLVSQYFSAYNQVKITIQSKTNGFITFPELNLLSTLNMFSLSHNSGKSLEISMRDFWIQEKEHAPEEKSKMFIVQNPCLEVPSKIMPLTILHLMALY